MYGAGFTNVGLPVQSPCQCEHKDHFERPGQSHTYGATFPIRQAVQVKTSYGYFWVCPACVNHMQPLDESGGLTL